MNCIYFQPTKCSNLRIFRKRISPYRSYSINDIDEELVSIEKDLGVVIVNDTSWTGHILIIVAKADRLLLEGAEQELLVVFHCCVFTVH